MLRFEYYDDWISIYRNKCLIGQIVQPCNQRTEFRAVTKILREDQLENGLNTSITIEDFEMIKYHMIKFSTKQNVKMNGKVMT